MNVKLFPALHLISYGFQKWIFSVTLQISRRSTFDTSARQPRFYFPREGKPSSNGMDFWRNILTIRDRYSARALTAEEKLIFYRDVKISLEKVLSHILRIRMPVTSEVQLAQIASISGDLEISLLIYKAFKAVGSEGLKMVMENLESDEDLLQIVQGTLLSNICVHPLFIMSQIGTDVFEDTQLLLCSGNPRPEDVTSYLKLASDKPIILIFNSISSSMLYFLLKQRLQNKIQLAAIELSKYSTCPLNLHDISLLTSASIINFGSGKDMPKENVFGKIGKVYVRQKYVLLLKINEDTAGKQAAIEDLQKETQFGLPGKDIIKQRLKSLLHSKVAILMLSGDTSMRRTQRMGCAADALLRAEAAAEFGLLPGAGRDLVEMLKILDTEAHDQDLLMTSSKSGTSIVTDAIRLQYQMMERRWADRIIREAQISRVKNVPLLYSYDPDLGQYINLIESGHIVNSREILMSLYYAGHIVNSREILMSLYYALERSMIYEQKILLSRKDKKTFPLFDEDVDPPN